MRSRLSFLLLALLPLSLLIACSVVSIDVSAETTWRHLTASETYAFYGSSIPCTYFGTDNNYHTVNLVPSTNRYVYTGTAYSGLPSWCSGDYVCYWANASDFSSNPSYLSIDLRPHANHFENCTSIRFCASAYNGNNTSWVSSSAYNDSFVDLYAGNTLHYSNSIYQTSDNYYMPITLTRSGLSAYWHTIAVPVEYDSNVLQNISVVRMGFNGARLDGSEIGVYLSCPYVSDGATVETGIVTETTSPSTGPDINVTVDVDLDETNSLLGDIISGIGNIFDDIVGAISSVFIPDDGYIENWADDMLDVIEDAYSDDINADVLKDALLDLTTYGATTSLRFPGVDLTGCGINFVIPAQAVDLKPLNDNNIYDAIATLIDILATIAVFNMVLNRIHAVFVGEKVVEIDGD